MCNKGINYVVFHKRLYNENYTCDPSFSHNKYVFVKGNPDYSLEIDKEFGYNIVYESHFDFYNPVLQRKLYMMPGVMYHIYKNGMHKDYNYVGFMEYDISLEYVESEDVAVTSRIDKLIGDSGERTYINYRNNSSFKMLYEQNYLLDGKNCIETIIKDYNSFRNTDYSVENFKNDDSKVNLQQSFLVDVNTFEYIMEFISYIIENELAERNDNPQIRPSTILERYFAFQLKVLNIESHVLTLNHDAIGDEVKYAY